MSFPLDLHPWNVSPKEAIAIQQQLRTKIIIEKITKPINTIAGCDISFDKNSDTIYAAIVVLQLPELIQIDYSTSISKTRFPYIPGLLSFREAPALLKAWKDLRTAADVLMIDGNGLAHPRRFGIACHIGLLLDMPTIGCAKSLFVGEFEEPAQKPGSYSLLLDKDEIVGASLRTVNGVKPVFVTIGHRATLEDAIDIVMKSVKGYRIPEPTRQAHLLSNAIRRSSTTSPKQQVVWK